MELPQTQQPFERAEAHTLSLNQTLQKNIPLIFQGPSKLLQLQQQFLVLIYNKELPGDYRNEVCRNDFENFPKLEGLLELLMYHVNPQIKYTVCNKGQSCTAHEGLTKHSFPGFFLAPAEANPQWRGPPISYLFPLHQSYFYYLESKSSVWPKKKSIGG